MTSPDRPAADAPHPYLATGPRPRVIAHRGWVDPAVEAAEGVVENTCAAVSAAVAIGADIVETDCHVTRDGHVVLVHDAHLDRVIGVDRAVADVTLAELRAMFRDRGEVLTLDEALEAFPSTRFNIDVKAEAAAVPLGRVVAPHGERVLVTSFSDRFRIAALRAARDRTGLAPATSPGRRALIRVLLAVASRSETMMARSLRGLDALQIPERQGALRVLSPRLIEAAHRHGVEVHVWTVNEAARMARLAGLGVDGIITDRTDVALAALRPARDA